MASSHPANPYDAVVAAAFDRLSQAQMDAFVTKLLHIKLRADAGSISSLEAAIEQVKVMLKVCPFQALGELNSALEAFNDGDDAELRFLLRKD